MVMAAPCSSLKGNLNAAVYSHMKTTQRNGLPSFVWKCDSVFVFNVLLILLLYFVFHFYIFFSCYMIILAFSSASAFKVFCISTKFIIIIFCEILRYLSLLWDSRQTSKHSFWQIILITQSTYSSCLFWTFQAHLMAFIMVLLLPCDLWNFGHVITGGCMMTVKLPLANNWMNSTSWWRPWDVPESSGKSGPCEKYFSQTAVSSSRMNLQNKSRLLQ